jgi:hypothetical protein
MNAARRKLPVVVTRRFERALEAILKWILYYRTADAVYLASVRHIRQAEYH